MFERTPEEIRILKQWHVWRMVKGTKIPLQIDGSAAKSNDPETWSEFEAAVDQAAFFDGIAFEITPPYVGIDLDGCLDEDGDLREWAWPILAHFDELGFIEVSPSGTGIKILVRGAKPEGMPCLHKIAEKPKQQIEVYGHSRFWTVTGDIYGGNDKISDAQHAIDWLNATYFQGKKQERKKPNPSPPLSYPPPSPPPTLLKRAQEYARAVPPAGEGSRNHTLFNLAGHLFSMNSGGLRLTESEVLEICQDWNGTLTDPLSDTEVERTVSSAGRNGTPREEKPDRPFPTEDQYPQVDISALISEIGAKPDPDFDDDAFCLKMVPPAGLIRQVFDYYCQTSHRRSNTMGLATAVTLAETLFGRRVRSHTDLRVNDYNVIIAPTSSGKEACETTISRICWQADPNRVPLLPPDVQSGNGLLKAVSDHPQGLWICDEFGKVLEAILDRKSNNGHAKQIGTHLLKLYSKASGIYGGAAHADGARNEIVQPHLCLLGLTTGQIFESIDSRQIQDGLFGRIAFWPVQNRPKRKTARVSAAPEDLERLVRLWLNWEPTSGLHRSVPKPEMIEMSDAALERWETHANAIDERMENESESRAAIWGRVAARAMKLGIVHRVARVEDDPSHVDWQFVRVELHDIDWGIQLANWLARVACGLIRENVVDRQHERAKAVLLAAAGQTPEGISHRDLTRAYRSISNSEFTAAANDLQANKRIEILQESSGGRPKVVYKVCGQNPG